MTGPAVLLDVAAIARAIRRPYSTVYRWGQTGQLERHGKDSRGRWLHDLNQAITLSENTRASTARAIRECVVPQGNGDECGTPALDGAPFPVCQPHALAVYAFVWEQINHADPSKERARTASSM